MDNRLLSCIHPAIHIKNQILFSTLLPGVSISDYFISLNEFNGLCTKEQDEASEQEEERKQEKQEDNQLALTYLEKTKLITLWLTY